MFVNKRLLNLKIKAENLFLKILNAKIIKRNYCIKIIFMLEYFISMHFGM
jgi:hypothetical protein